MRQLVQNIIERKLNNYFEFYRDYDNPIKHLKNQTNSVPNCSGLYLVFSKKKSFEISEHLNFEIENEIKELLYFGKAGGITKKGKVIKQGLNGRINNVVSDSHRNLKDIKRANYWNVVMNDNDFDKLTIIYFIDDNPQEIEDVIYSFLDERNLRYPLMNKKRGRKTSHRSV